MFKHIRFNSSQFFQKIGSQFSTISGVQKVFNIEHVNDIKFRWVEEIAPIFSKNGFVLINLKNASEKNLLEIAKLFGPIQRNRNTNFSGVTNVVSDNKAVSAQNNQVVSSLEFLAHTDGAYLQGVASDKGGTYVKVSPPKILLLECIKPSLRGGETILVDGKRALSKMLRTDPEHIKALFDNECMNMLHGGVNAIHVPVFKRLRNGVYTIRYSYDSELHYSKRFTRPLEVFNACCLSPSFKQKLEPEQILIIDNERMLHAREKIYGSRFFRRVWVGNPTEKLYRPSMKNELYISNKKNTIHDPMESYLNIDNTAEYLEIETGIRISTEMDKLILNAIQKDSFNENFGSVAKIYRS